MQNLCGASYFQNFSVKNKLTVLKRGATACQLLKFSEVAVKDTSEHNIACQLILCE